ncbi:glycosyltransferase family 4 protein [Cesiribacter andamanensis]|uniref:Mannosylfructose-phosphate synthase n=1 Tax=Cesiribacter andamanensis AMV16 TaxID=1279009 RepID=M7N877_9BACT|nr:glycosyltransferase family 1 protein [Cesiribacter andamanensis]EMR03416.1 Mannosylfructose-phosphate synthase [Cesiribacter andamanensis AMV16]
MKIGFDAKRAFFNHTGLGNYSRFVLRTLTDHFPHHQYLLYSPRAAGKVHPELQPLLELPNVQASTPSGVMAQFGLSALWRSYSLAKVAAAHGADLLHGLSNELPFGKSTKLKQVVTIHDVLFLRYPHLYNLLDLSIYKQKTAWACKAADKIIAVSQQTAQDLIDFYKVPASKIEVVYQGCHPSFREEYDSYVLDRVASKYSLPQDFILNVGTLEPRKNALLILKALTQLRSKTKPSLVLVGKETEYKNELIAYARKENLMDQLYFRHNVSFEDLPKVYQLSRMFVYPSVFEGFGIPILEALCSRVPVITSKGSCFDEAGGPHSLYINPNDPEELADAILRIYNNATMATKMTIDGVAHSLNFEEERLAGHLMQVYEKVLGS